MRISNLKKYIIRKKRKNLIIEPFDNDLYNFVINVIDNKNINEIEKLKNYFTKNNKNDKNNTNDIIFELYNNKLLTTERLQFIMKNCSKYFEISSNLIKKLIKDEKVDLLDIIFSHLYFYDNAFILQLLLYYKNKTKISVSELNQQLSNEKFKIPISSYYAFEPCNNTGKYLINECYKKDINIYIIKCLIKYGVDVNKSNEYGKTPLFYACKKGNESKVKYLVEQGADINKEGEYNETPLFTACKNGNESIVKYLVEHGADINKKGRSGKTPLFTACEKGNEAILKYLVEHGADVNKKNEYSETPLFLLHVKKEMKPL